MTKRMIDADALLDWANRELRHAEKAIERAIFDKRVFDENLYHGVKSMAEYTIEKINELATPVAEPQGETK